MLSTMSERSKNVLEGFEKHVGWVREFFVIRGSLEGSQDLEGQSAGVP